MIDSKFLATMAAIIITVFAISRINSSNGLIKEGFWGNSGNPRTVKVYREVRHPNGKIQSVQNNYQSMFNDSFVSRPNFQGILSPRFSNVDYGANIRYNMPSYKHQGAPCDPLAMSDMVKEGYKGCNRGKGIAYCGKGGIPLNQDTSLMPQGMGHGSISDDPNYTTAMNNVYQDFAGPIGTDTLAVGDMRSLSADGNITQPIVYDRYIYANQKSRLRSLGDPIRGDLPIVPCNNGWFNPSVNPNIDLHEGALNVMGGIRNTTANSLADLQNITSGGIEQISAGVDMANTFDTELSAGVSDVNVTSFP